MNKKQKDALFIVLIILAVIAIIVMFIAAYKLLSTPDKLEDAYDIPPISDFTVNHSDSEVVEDAVYLEDEPVVEDDVVPEDEETTDVVQEESSDNKLAPNDDMIYGAMASTKYKELCKKLGVELRVGIVDVKDTNDGIVITFILDNTDAMFYGTVLNGTTAYSDIVNKYSDEYPIVYFKDGVPEYSADMYAYISNAYAGNVMTSVSGNSIEYELYNIDQGVTVSGYMN